MGRAMVLLPEPAREPSLSGTFLTQPHIDHAITALASVQHLVFDLGQLRDLGLSDSGVRSRVARARLHRVHRGVHSLVPRELLTAKGRWMAAVLACGPGAALSHASAGSLLGLRPSDSALIDVTVPRRSRSRHPGIRVHCSTTLIEDDVTLVDSIPCTNIARTQLDLADMVSRRGVERAFDQAEAMGVFNLAALQDQLDRNPSRRATKVVRDVLATHYIGSTLTDSELEELGLKMTRMMGIPDPEVQVWIDPGDGDPPIRRDFVWRAQRIVLEIDSWKFHRSRQAFNRDRRNDRRLLVAGWYPLRATDHQLEHEPRQVGCAVLALMRA